MISFRMVYNTKVAISPGIADGSYGIGQFLLFSLFEIFEREFFRLFVGVGDNQVTPVGKLRMGVALVGGLLHLLDGVGREHKN